MQIDWEVLEEFPQYAVSNYGDFANMRSGHPIRVSRNQQGHAKITLYKDRQLITRSAAILVAKAFISQSSPLFGSPIHLDGDLMNCRADNLMWRPRWFAIKYQRQFQYDLFHLDHTVRRDSETGEIYAGLKDVCTKNGLYYADVVRSEVEGGPVFPTNQEFDIVD